jgi:riboflavin transporter FmnP
MKAMTEKKLFTVREIITIAIMAALSIVLVYLIHISLFLPFLEYDPADIPIFITTFAFGPLVGFILTAIVSVLQWIFVSAESGIIGVIMHIVATGTFVLVAGNIYKRNKTLRQAVIALVAGVAAWTAMMAAWNILLTPLYTGMPREEILPLIIPVFVPFNLIKAGANALITFLLYKRVKRIFGGRMGRLRG